MDYIMKSLMIILKTHSTLTPTKNGVIKNTKTKKK